MGRKQDALGQVTALADQGIEVTLSEVYLANIDTATHDRDFGDKGQSLIRLLRGEDVVETYSNPDVTRRPPLPMDFLGHFG